MDGFLVIHHGETARHRVGTPGAGPRRVAKARDRAPFRHWQPFVRQPRGDTRVTPEDKLQTVAQRVAEIAERQVIFDDNNNN